VALEKGGVSVDMLVIDPGEQTKSFEGLADVIDRLLALELDRGDVVVAFGGGVVGDLTGFAAAIYKRGVDFVQIPTTLLAQVDAAIGGKTGVDLPGGKNTVGLFHHPAMVVADTAVLSTLPAAELRSGLVEVIKMAALLDPELFRRVERDLPALLAGEAAALGPVVAGAAAAKIRVVERDPDEQGERRLLNFGHTLGHAVESACRYQGLRHGEAVGYGLLFAWRLSEARGLAPQVAARGRRLLERLALPPLPALDPAELVELMARDKKARESGLTWVLQRGLGEGEMVEMPVGAGLAAEIADFLRAPFGRVLV